MQYAMLTFAALLLAVNFAMNKVYQGWEGTSPEAGFGFNALLGLFTAAVFFVINGFEMEFTGYSFIMAVLMNSLVVAYTLLGFKLLRSGSMALYTLFLMAGGMAVPYLWGLIFLDESFSILRTVGLVLIFVSVVLSNFSAAKVNSKQVIMCVAVFVLNGFVSVISKIHQIETSFLCVNATEFVILGGIFKFIFCGILYTFVKKRGGARKELKAHYKSLIIIAGAAVVSGVSYLMQLWGAESLPATVLYPFLTGGTIAFSTLTGIVLFKEKLSKKLTTSVVLCVIGTIMFL